MHRCETNYDCHGDLHFKRSECALTVYYLLTLSFSRTKASLFNWFVSSHSVSGHDSLSFLYNSQPLHLSVLPGEQTYLCRTNITSQFFLHIIAFNLPTHSFDQPRNITDARSGSCNYKWALEFFQKIFRFAIAI